MALVDVGGGDCKSPRYWRGSRSERPALGDAGRQLGKTTRPVFQPLPLQQLLSASLGRWQTLARDLYSDYTKLLRVGSHLYRTVEPIEPSPAIPTTTSTAPVGQRDEILLHTSRSGSNVSEAALLAIFVRRVMMGTNR